MHTRSTASHRRTAGRRGCLQDWVNVVFEVFVELVAVVLVLQPVISEI